MPDLFGNSGSQTMFRSNPDADNETHPPQVTSKFGPEKWLDGAQLFFIGNERGATCGITR
jgi:hypothetical protein